MELAGFRGTRRRGKQGRSLVGSAGLMLLLVFSSVLRSPHFPIVNRRCANLHQKLLPRSISKGTINTITLPHLFLVLCLEWDTHYWSKEDLIECAKWGNYSAQKYTSYVMTDLADTGLQGTSAVMPIKRSFGSLRLMDSGVPGWPREFDRVAC